MVSRKILIGSPETLGPITEVAQRLWLVYLGLFSPKPQAKGQGQLMNLGIPPTSWPMWGAVGDRWAT